MAKFAYTSDLPEDKSLPFLAPHEFENGAIYEGQWKEGSRHGRGVQSWPDGSYYEGYWRNNQANGKGRLVHADGDTYMGDWYNDKGMQIFLCPIIIR